MCVVKDWHCRRIHGSINLFIYLFRGKTLKVNIFGRGEKNTCESHKNIKRHCPIFNERAIVNVKYLKMYA